MSAASPPSFPLSAAVTTYYSITDIDLARHQSITSVAVAPAAGYESLSQPGLYFAGTLAHGRDWRRATGGVIHGFRHTAEALFHVLESRLHGVRWPSRELPFHVRDPAMTEHGSFGCSLVSLSSNLHRLHGPSDG